MIHSLNIKQAGAELYQVQFKQGLAKQALPNKDFSYVIIKKSCMTKVGQYASTSINQS